jgi:hypothetical protein
VPRESKRAATQKRKAQAQDDQANFPPLTKSHLNQLYDRVPEFKDAKEFSSKKDMQICWLLAKLKGDPLPVLSLVEANARTVSPQYYALSQLVRTYGLVVLKLFACVSGCDYIDLKGIGQAKAIAILTDVLPRDHAVNCDLVLFRDIAAEVAKRVKSLTAEAIAPELQRAFHAFHHPVVFDPRSNDYRHAHPYLGERTLDASVVGALPDDLELALQQTMGLDSKHAPQAPESITEVQRVGDTLPTVLQCWMLPGSRPCMLPSLENIDAVKQELLKQELSIEGTDVMVMERANRHNITLRKAPENMSVEECRGVLRSREISASGACLAALRQAVQRLYTLEDQPGYGAPRLKDPIGISLLAHLIKAGHAQLSVQDDTEFTVPQENWVSAQLGLPITMEVIRAYFVSVGETLTGEFKSKAIKEAWARICNCTSLQNFGYHGLIPRDEDGDDDDDAEASAGGVKEQEEGPTDGECFYKLDVSASMKACAYESVSRLRVRDGQIVEVISGRCGGECAAGPSGKCWHVAANLIAAANVLRPLQRNYKPPSTSQRCAWNRPSPGDSYNYLRPVCFIPFTHEDINDIDKSNAQPCRQSTLGRGGLNPFPAHVHLRTRDHPDVKSALEELYHHLASVHPGRQKCAADAQWPSDFRGDQSPTDHSMLALEDARRWKVLRGDYLADKGFLIHDLLARYSAGLYKPPHRRRGKAQLTPDEIATTRRVANMRIHVERNMRRAREFHMLNNTLPISRADLGSAEAFACFFLGNLQPPLFGNDFFDQVYSD